MFKCLLCVCCVALAGTVARADALSEEVPVPGGTQWRRVVDTNVPEAAEAVFKVGDPYGVTGRSFLLLVAQIMPTPQAKGI